MKKLVFVITAILLFSCSTGFKQKGTFKLTNGASEKVSISYDISNYEDYKKMFSKEDFNIIVREASCEAKKNCKYELTYQLISIVLFSSNDTTTTIFKFSAKNAFGVPDESTAYCEFKGTNLIHSF